MLAVPIASARAPAADWIFKTGFVLIAAFFSYYAAGKPVDFPVYHYAARAMLEGNKPIYGPESGIGWPMVYRYPPLFLLLFVPFAWLPLKLAAGIWAALKFVVLYPLVRALAKQLGGPKGTLAWLVAALLAGRYVVVEFRYGNAQFYMFALVAASFLWLHTRPKAAAGALALATSLKVWPLFFFPYLAARREWRVLTWALLLVIGLTLLPALYFGWNNHLELLNQWATQELSMAGAAAGVGFPGQSLQEVLIRYLTVVDFSRMPDPNYPRVNVLALDPSLVKFLWLLVAGLCYATLLGLARRSVPSEEWTAHGLAFCGLSLLQPHTHTVHLVVLLWPALVAGSLLNRDAAMFPRWARQATYAAAALVVIQSLAPSARIYRFLQVAGVDFLVTCLLTLGLAGAYILSATMSNPLEATAMEKADPHRAANLSNRSANSARLPTSTSGGLDSSSSLPKP